MAVVDVEQNPHSFWYHGQKQPDFELVPYFVSLLVPVDAHYCFVDDEYAFEENEQVPGYIEYV